jgi:hypothetical protein
MRVIYAAAIAITLLSSLAVGRAQSRPSPADVAAFEGTWVLDAIRSGLTDADAERRVITVGPTWMRVEVHRPEDAHPITLTYNFDGSRTVNAFGAGTAESKLTREAEGLLLQTVFTIRNQPITVDELLPTQPNGTELAIAVMLRVEHGYQGVAPATGRTPPNVSKATKYFRKQP